jgi:myo-inositol 2-dehydrogenase/D-chiro-inositol 1-dehydrogenase
MELAGTKAVWVVGLDDRAPLRSAEPGVRWPDGQPYTGFLDRFRAAYQAELAAFVDYARGRTPSPCTGADALAALLIAEACERSRREGRPVAVEEVAG